MHIHFPSLHTPKAYSQVQSLSFYHDLSKVNDLLGELFIENLLILFKYNDSTKSHNCHVYYTGQKCTSPIPWSITFM